MRFNLLLLLVYNQELDYYPFAVKLDKLVGRCLFQHTLNHLSNKKFVSNEAEELNLNIFNIFNIFNNNRNK